MNAAFEKWWYEVGSGITKKVLWLEEDLETFVKRVAERTWEECLKLTEDKKEGL